MAVVPPALVVNVVSARALPTGAVKVVVPMLLAIKAFVPSTAPVNVMSPEPALTVRLLFSVVVLPKETVLLVVVSVAVPAEEPLVTAPALVCLPLEGTVLVLIVGAPLSAQVV